MKKSPGNSSGMPPDGDARARTFRVVRGAFVAMAWIMAGLTVDAAGAFWPCSETIITGADAAALLDRPFEGFDVITGFPPEMRCDGKLKWRTGVWSAENMSFGAVNFPDNGDERLSLSEPLRQAVHWPGMLVETDYEAVAQSGRQRAVRGAAALAAAGILALAMRRCV